MKQVMKKGYMNLFLLLIILAIGMKVSVLSAKAAANGWVKNNGQTFYYVNSAPVTGYHTIDDEGYYFDQYGVMKTGEVTIQGKTYYFNPKDGKMKFGWVTTGGKEYYYSINGTVGTHVKVTSVKGKYKKGSIYGSGLSKKQLKSVKKKVISFMNKKIATNMTTYEKIKEAHDYICNNTRYKSGSNARNAYGALVKKKAVCSGYARAFVALCDAMGIKSKLISATNFTHTWNLVKIGSNWYHIDVQSDDSYGVYIIFLEKDSYLKSVNVRWSKKMPKCSKRYTYKITVPEEGTL